MRSAPMRQATTGSAEAPKGSTEPPIPSMKPPLRLAERPMGVAVTLTCYPQWKRPEDKLSQRVPKIPSEQARTLSEGFRHRWRNARDIAEPILPRSGLGAQQEGQPLFRTSGRSPRIDLLSKVPCADPHAVSEGSVPPTTDHPMPFHLSRAPARGKNARSPRRAASAPHHRPSGAAGASAPRPLTGRGAAVRLRGARASGEERRRTRA